MIPLASDEFYSRYICNGNRETDRRPVGRGVCAHANNAVTG